MGTAFDFGALIELIVAFFPSLAPWLALLVALFGGAS